MNGPASPAGSGREANSKRHFAVTARSSAAHPVRARGSGEAMSPRSRRHLCADKQVDLADVAHRRALVATSSRYDVLRASRALSVGRP
jgi:hypothetical protein